MALRGWWWRAKVEPPTHKLLITADKQAEPDSLQNAAILQTLQARHASDAAEQWMDPSTLWTDTEGETGNVGSEAEKRRLLAS